MSKSLSPSTSDFLDGLTKLGGAIVGLSLFAYIAGYVRSLAMYKSIGGVWVIEFLSAQDVLRVGSYSLVMVGVVFLCGTYICFTRGWVWLKILSFWLAGVMVSFFMFAPKAGWNDDWLTSYESVGFIGGVLFLTSGCLLSGAGFLYISVGVSRKVVVLVLLGGLISLYVIPNYLGKAWGHEVLAGRAGLPKTSDVKSNCYLLGGVNSKYLIGCFSEGKMVMVRMVEIDKEVSFNGYYGDSF